MRVFSSVFLLLLLTFISIGQPIGSDSVNSFELLNSPYDELSPVISPDGKTLYVTIANHPSNCLLWFSVTLISYQDCLYTGFINPEPND